MGPSIKYARFRRAKGGQPKGYFLYKIPHFSYTNRVKGVGGGLKYPNFGRTYFIDDPYRDFNLRNMRKDPRIRILIII